ncbi:N-formylglutamate amidohydrolase [Rhodohalobacter sp. SW132]|uniref:N-formylglutamate amidohydrolase n=1 Tax=Rhodohalobacter sp. SW132 TaxID=2293433 RepID=UPI000E27ACCA|nr:N-formylglutamate amidohydrolase [Rhodohalobacter sp. SW132]REL37834.1 N-formylglutamate amidohydrolase [Rhodohalobacter sp. SW132]
MSRESYRFYSGEGPVVAVALHSGHDVRNVLKPLYNLTDSERLREEDPHTDLLTTIVPSRIIVRKSRFEVDLNRERSLAVYRKPEDAWGLNVWKEYPEEELVEKSLAMYDRFYADSRVFLGRIIQKYGYVIVYDIHCYNHMREGPHAEPADPAGNPDVNLGTENLNRHVWGAVVDGLANDLRTFNYPGGPLTVGENIRFKGGHFSRWIQQEFGDQSCAIAIEFKKIFMNEWTHELDPVKFNALYNALKSTLPGLLTHSKQITEVHAGGL